MGSFLSAILKLAVVPGKSGKNADPSDSDAINSEFEDDEVGGTDDWLDEELLGFLNIERCGRRA